MIEPPTLLENDPWRVYEGLGPDNENNYPEAITKMSQASMRYKLLLWMYTDGSSLIMTSEYDGNRWIAKCWPGGRVESKRSIF